MLERLIRAALTGTAPAILMIVALVAGAFALLQTPREEEPQIVVPVADVLIEAPTGDTEKWRGPYIKQLRPDPWSKPYEYRFPGTHHPTSFDVYSRGADGADGGEGQGADVGNWQ